MKRPTSTLHALALVSCVTSRGTSLSTVRPWVATDLALRGPPLLYCVPGNAVGDAATLAAGCAAGVQPACVREGVALALGPTDLRDPGRALAVFEQACAAGDGCGCIDVAASLGARRDRASLQRAAELYRQGCDHGLARACVGLAVAYRGGIAVGDGGPWILPRDPTASHALAVRACEAHDSAGCFHAAADFMAGGGTPREDRQAVERLQQSCDGGVDVACSMEGLALLDGRGVDRDPAAAAERFDRGCSLGDPLGCLALATMYRDGLATAPDPDRETVLMAQACAGGLRAACHRDP